jgi:hypothetical protein
MGLDCAIRDRQSKLNHYVHTLTNKLVTEPNKGEVRQMHGYGPPSQNSYPAP